METKTKKPANNTPAKQSNIVDAVLAKVTQFEQLGEIRLPKDYSAENALKSAYLILQETKDSNSKLVLESCSKESIANALLEMVVQGLSPMKRQGSFIAYAGKLQWQKEYAGNIALAKRFGNVKTVTSNVIYEKDDFEYTIDPKTGKREIIKHVQKIDNIDLNKIKGAYATLIFNDDTTDTEVLTMSQIRQSWQQGHAKGNSPAHKNFPDQMAKKTAINRACKLVINSSDDGVLMDDDDQRVDPNEARAREEIKSNANRESLDIQDTEYQEEQAEQHDRQSEPEKQELEKPKETEAASAESQSTLGPGF